jgi:hypothetical protein
MTFDDVMQAVGRAIGVLLVMIVLFWFASFAVFSARFLIWVIGL